MKYKLLFIAIAITVASCDKIQIDDSNHQKYDQNSIVHSETRAFNAVVLGKKKNNPYSVVNMQAALDTLKAHPDDLESCLKSAVTLNEIKITTTDLYVRFLPKNKTQYRKLKTDETLTLFDFPLDYEIVKNGDYYFDPSVSGEFTWLYTRVPKNYKAPAGITYEVLEELFIMENSQYYSEEIISDSLKSITLLESDIIDALKTIEAIAFFNTGNPYGVKSESEKNESDINLKAVKLVKKTFLWDTWYEYEYYPSGTIKVQSSHKMDNYGNTTRYSSLTDVPLKGVKVHFWDGFFKWNSAYTDENGYYESSIFYNNDLYYDLYFSGYNGSNSWSLDRVMLWGVCLWVQKVSLGDERESNDGYSTTITTSSGAWDACVANNAFYEFMTVCDKEGLTCPPSSLQVALRELGGMSSAPLLQNLSGYYDSEITAAFFASMVYIDGATAPYWAAYELFLAAVPDILISGGNLNANKTSSGVKIFYSTIWHELTHASNYQLVLGEKGYGYAANYWALGVAATEIGHTVATGWPYGIKGDNNWAQIALCEGWAYFIQRTMGSKYINYYPTRLNFPWNYYDMYNSLVLKGCSIIAIEECLTAKNISDFKQLLINKYPNLSTDITNIINGYV
jgi:hypothetical protein